MKVNFTWLRKLFRARSQRGAKGDDAEGTFLSQVCREECKIEDRMEQITQDPLNGSPLPGIESMGDMCVLNLSRENAIPLPMRSFAFENTLHEYVRPSAAPAQYMRQ